jgi:hypothetical protein
VEKLDGNFFFLSYLDNIRFSFFIRDTAHLGMGDWEKNLGGESLKHMRIFLRRFASFFC